jgi:hypothetical protein
MFSNPQGQPNIILADRFTILEHCARRLTQQRHELLPHDRLPLFQ